MKGVANLETFRIESSVIAAIIGAEIRNDPFPVHVLRDVLPEEEVARLLTMCRESKFKPWSNRFFLKLAEDDPISHAMNSSRVRAAIEKAVGAIGKPTPQLNYDPAGVELEVHPDATSKAGTMQIYLEGDPEDGTVVYRKPSERVFKVPFARNCGYMFRRTGTSWHGFDKVRQDRWSLLVPIFLR